MSPEIARTRRRGTPRPPSHLVRLAATALALWPGVAAAGYTEAVTFSFQQAEISYKAPISTAYLLLDEAEGMNPLCEAIPMTPQGGGVFSTTVTLPEGDYIYVFVANADQYVDLSDCGLNPDDVPDANFFNDPHPKFPGLAGQFGKDNVYFVRSPDRPRFVAASASPLPGTLVTSRSFTVSVEIEVGASRTPIAASSARVRFERTEPPGLWRPEGPVGPPEVIEVTPVSFAFDPGTGRATISATITDPPEGFHRIFVDAAGTDGLAADTFTTSVLVNRDDRPPVADAGPTRFARVGGAVQLDGGGSFDPDRIGLAAYSWRVISGPGSASFVYVDEERVLRDGFGKPLLDDDGLQQGQVSSTPNATPRFEPHAPGRYVIGLRVTDKGGQVSAEDTTEVWVVPSFDPSRRVRLEVSEAGGVVTIDARSSRGIAGASFRWIPDANNPAPLSLSPVGDGSRATLPRPAPGIYFVHAQAGDSYPATAVVRVDASGRVTGSDLGRPPRFWSEEAIVYLVFPREVKDSDGDGRGDFQGLIERIPYLRALGVNALWIMPITPGPTSHGYAATAHFDVEEDYGTIADWDAFVAAAHAAGMRIVFDLVANHTSNRHPFFEAAVRNPASPLRDLYVFNPDGTYEYAFDFATLPSWNYNNPVARRLFLDVVEFWMDHGVDAFRADIAGFVPPSFWRAVRRVVRGRSDEAMLLAEIVPPHAGFFDGEQFDMAYDAHLFWNFKDLFATTGGLDGFDAALDAAERFVADAIRIVRERQDPANVLRLRYLDNQDEDRFLLKAGRNLSRQRAAAGVLLALPGVPMIYYGDEVGAVQMRGPLRIDANPDLLELYRRLVAVRRANAGLRGQDSGALGEPGDTFTRINSDADPGGYSIYSFARYREGQRFVVLVNRFDASVLGTQVKYWPPPSILGDFPEEGLFLQNHLDPTDLLPAHAATLPQGFTSAVGAYETKIYQLVDHPIPDSDDDRVLDSWDNCILRPNGLQDDGDGDGVGDACDACAGTAVGTAVGLDGCAAPAGAPRARYDIFDGVVDDDAYRVADGLWASFNGRELYVATHAAAPGRDRFVLVAADPTGVGRVAAPFGKAGTTAGATRVLADEGDNDYAAWLGVTGQARASAALVARAEAGTDASAVVEGTLNLQEQFGTTLPERIWIAAAEYEGQDGGALTWQSPAAVTPNGDIEADEFFEFPLPDPTPATPPGPPDFDGDGVRDREDNCPGIANPEQEDFDRDGVGDLCDACPASAPAATVDGQGCTVEDYDPKMPLDDPTQNLACGCRAGGRSGAGGAVGRGGIALAAGGLVLMMAAAAKITRRRCRRR